MPTRFFLPTNLFFAHEFHEFSCKRVQNRTCSSYAERSRKCQRNLHEFFALQFNGDLVGRTNIHESNDGGSGMSFLTTTGMTLDNKSRGRCAWNFRASERRAELVRAMPSAAENLEEVALRHRTCLNHPSPSLH